MNRLQATLKLWYMRLNMLSPGKNDDEMLASAYWDLREIIHFKPKLTKQALAVLNIGLRSGKNGKKSLECAYDIIGDFNRKKSFLKKEGIAELLCTTTDLALQSNETESHILESAYDVLYKILEVRPALADDIFKTLNRTLSYENKSSTSLTYAYSILNRIVKEKPELAEQILTLFNVALQSENNNTTSLRKAYACMSMVTHEHPKFAEAILKILNIGMHSDKRYRDHLKFGCFALRDILRVRPDLSEQVLSVLVSLLSENDKSLLLGDVRDVLGDIAKARPDLTETILNMLQTNLPSDNNKNGSMDGEYNVLGDIIKSYPELAEKMFANFNAALKSDCANNKYSLTEAYIALNEIVNVHPELAEYVLDALQTGLQSVENSEETLKSVYEVLENIAKQRPELTKKILEIANIGLNLNKNSSYSLKAAGTLLYKTIENVGPENMLTELNASLYSKENKCYSPLFLSQALKYIMEIQPDLAEPVLNTLNVVIQTEKNNSYALIDLFSTLKKIVETRSDLINRSFEAFKSGLQSDNNDGNSLGKAYSILREIIEAHPEMKEQVFDIVRQGLQSDKNDGYSLEEAYHTLREIVKAQPERIEQVLNTVKTCLQSDKNYTWSLKNAYIDLQRILEAQPELTEPVFDAFKIALRSHKNNGESLVCAYNTLQLITEAHPEIKERILACVNIGLQSYNNDAASLKKAYVILRDIAETQPEFTEPVLDAVQNGLQSGKNDKYSLIAARYTLKACIKRLLIEEAITKWPNMKQDLRIAHKGRFASDIEFKYALGNFDKDQLANSMIFSAQQRVMNVLVSASAQEAGISKEDAVAFRKPDAPEAIKDYMENNNDWLIPLSFRVAAFFKSYFPAYIKQIQNHNRKNPDDTLSIHDAVYWLPEPNVNEQANARLAEFIRNNIIYQNAEHQMVHRPLDELKIIAQNWKALENKMQKQDANTDITKLRYSDVLSICMSVKYENQRNDIFAVEAAKHGTPEDEYHNCEDIYLAGLKVPEPFDNKKEFREGKYTGRFLPRDDVRTGFFGDYTNCCQHFGGAGNSCAVSTVKHPFSQLFVIEDDKGKIIAGSWTWENTEGDYHEVCFDNIEALGELKNRPEINQIYEQVGKYLTEEQNCRRVTIGLGYQDADVSGYNQTEAIELPKLYGNDGTNSYSDARSQVLLSENEKAEPLDKTKESQRYIRDVCCLDKAAMERVSNAVFPDSDKELQAPDNMAGFVIEDREKGVVGYCLYNIEEKSIYDMAVLPEYRTDKNASSKKLFAEMMKTIRQEGGQWSAEMRDKTTLKYLEIMAERGLVKFEKHGVDHTMSDGSQVVKVTFEPIRDDVRQAKNKLKGKLEENTAQIVDLKPKANTQDKRTHGVVIVKDSDVREA